MSSSTVHETAEDSRVGGILSCGIVTLIAAYVAVGLRLLARKQTGFGAGADDYLIIAALLLYTTYLALTVLAIHYGMGKHGPTLPNVKNFVITMTVVEEFYVLTVLFIKASILALYLRLFPVPKFSIAVWTMMAVNIAYCVVFMILTIVQCLPIESHWNPEVPGKCMNYYAVVLSGGILNIITDVTMLAMPIPLICQLQMPLRKKINVFAVFTIGTCACFVAIMRCIEATSVQSEDPAWQEVTALQLSQVEHCIGIISACVPSYRPLIRVIRGLLNMGPVPLSTSSESMGYGCTTTITVDQLQSPKSVAASHIRKTESIVVSVGPNDGSHHAHRRTSFDSSVRTQWKGTKRNAQLLDSSSQEEICPKNVDQF